MANNKEGKLNLEIGKKVSEFEAIMTKFKIKQILYKLIFRGKGLEFEGYREYSPSDDAGRIDWKASARANELLIKNYIEERDLKIMFVVDVSENMIFGSTDKLKCEYAAELVAAVAHLIITFNDKIGFVFFNDEILKVVMPKAGKKRFNFLVSELEKPSNYGKGHNLKKTLNYLLEYLDVSISAVFLISDFINVKQADLETLRLFSSKFETVALIIRDPLDREMPPIKKEVVIEDPNTKEQVIINPMLVKNQYDKYAKEREKEVKDIFEDAMIDHLILDTSKSFSPPLALFLKQRTKQRKYVTKR